MKLRSAGYNSRSSKEVIDSASAVEILEIALAIEKNTGGAPGQLVGDSVGA
jgi:RNase H-fold protein (predicted Holliday junction resolvase)